MAKFHRLSLVFVFIVCLTVYNVKAQTKYMLDNSNNSDCGKIMKIHPNEEILLTSSGRAPKDVGFCSAVVYAVGKEDQNCHGVCMTVNSQYINVCHAKIQFKGVIFGKDDDPFRELSCFHRLPSEWCFYSNVLSVEIVETHFYAFEMTSQSYNFSVKVSPLCDNSPFGKEVEAREAADRKRAADARSRSRNHGILVGVCLAIVFLIALLITWCYYKNKPFRTDVHNYPTATVRKGPTFAGFKARMTFHKAASSEDGEAKPKKEKKHKHGKDEASTENEETKPKKRGLRFFNKLRSSRGEEVPLVEKKDGKDAADGKIEEINEIKEDEIVDNKKDKDKDDKPTESKDSEIEVTKSEEVVDDVNKTKPEDSVDITPAEKEGNPDLEPTAKMDTPSVTVTTPGDNENDSKNDSSDDS